MEWIPLPIGVENFEDIRGHGYLFGESEVYNPRSVINYVDLCYKNKNIRKAILVQYKFQQYREKSDRTCRSLCAAGNFLAVFPLMSRILDAGANVLVGFAVDHTGTRQGKARPYLLLSAVLMPVTGILMFLIPNVALEIRLLWIVASYNLFFGVASSIYTMSHNMMIPLSTRDLKQRAELSALSSMSGNALAGTLSGVLIPLLVLPAIGIDRESWTVMACVVSILALPLTLLEYYYTRERVTEEDGERFSGSGRLA